MYLEFWTTWKEELQVRKRSAPFVGGFGFEWDPRDASRSVITRYTCHPLIGVETMLERAAAVADSPRSRTPLALTRALVEAAAARVPTSKMLYLEAEEDQNPRKSFDINVLQARLSIEEIYPQVAGLAAHYALEPDAFRVLYKAIRGEVLSHIQGGVDREGREFTTVYDGADPHQATSPPPG